MWVSDKVASLFSIAKETVDSLREDLAAVRAERDTLKLQLSISQNHFDFLRIRVNALEMERVQLLEKAYGIKVPAPEIARTSVNTTPEVTKDIFEDMGEEYAKKFGLPLYNS